MLFSYTQPPILPCTSRPYRNNIKVILDKDLALLYGIGTRDLNKSVTRNLDRFPADFMFQLTREGFKNLKCHF